MIGAIIKDIGSAHVLADENADGNDRKDFASVSLEHRSSQGQLGPAEEIERQIADISEKVSDDSKGHDSDEDSIARKVNRSDSKGPDDPSASSEFHMDEFYRNARAAYQQFLNDYLSQTTSPAAQAYQYSSDEKTAGVASPWSAEMMPLKERMNVVRKIMMNSLVGAGSNHVSPEESERYKMWTMVLKANQQLSFIYRDSIIY